MTTSKQKIIYDFGSNNGDDIPYYLKKADVVVAVEANPSLCDEIERRFPVQMETGRLFVENCVLTSDGSSSDVVFYIHKVSHVLSQFPKPEADRIHKFDEVLLPSKSVSSLIEKYGEPYYVKIDIERCDAAILRALFLNNIYPPYISAESHNIETFAILVSLGSYGAFKLVDGNTVAKKYKDHSISVGHQRELYSFPFHSAGPFGEDVDGDWMVADDFFQLLAFEQLGWKDIHATNQVLPCSLSPGPGLKHYVKHYVKRACRQKIIDTVKQFVPRSLVSK